MESVFLVLLFIIIGLASSSPAYYRNVTLDLKAAESTHGLVINSKIFGNESAIQLRDSLVNNTNNIFNLSLVNCVFQQKSLSIIFNSLNQTGIKSLTLDGNMIIDQPLKVIATGLAKSHLEQLFIKNALLGDSAWPYIMKAIIRMKSLVSIRLWDVSMEENQFLELVQYACVSNSAALRSLDLRKNFLSDELKDQLDTMVNQCNEKRMRENSTVIITIIK